MLFKSIEQIQQYISIGNGNDFEKIKPHIKNAETKFIKPLLGTEMYDELIEFFDASPIPNPNPVQELTFELFELVQNATIHLAYFLGFDLLNASISDSGFQRIESNNLKSLYRYQEDSIKNYFQEAGLNLLDDVLLFLEENIDDFTEFKNNANWITYKESFLPNVKTVQSIPYNIFGSRLILLALQPHIQFIEDTQIRLCLGDAIYEEIKTEMVKDTPAAKVTAILPYIRKPLIYMSVAMLMEQTGATLGNKGLFFETTEANYKSSKTKQPSETSDKSYLIRLANNRGNIYLDMLKTKLATDDWTDVTNTENAIFKRDNNDKKTFFA